MANKKIRNATACKSSSITFKSQLEKIIYNTLIEQGFTPKYEPKRIVLLNFEPCTVPFYDKETDTQYKKRLEEGGKSPKLLNLKSNVLLPITYTPDFYIQYNNIDVWIEAKGMENDVYYLKKKLFRRYLENQSKQGIKSIFFEIYSKKQLLQAIEIFKQYAEKCNTRIDKGG